MNKNSTSTNHALINIFKLLNGPQTMGRGWLFWTGFFLFVILAFLGPTYFGFKPYKVNEFIVSGFLAASLSILWGYCGILSLGQAAFFGIGGYVWGIVGINLWDDSGNTHLAFIAGTLALYYICLFGGFDYVFCSA